MLSALIIPESAMLVDVMETQTATRLINAGASLWLTTSGASVLSVARPAGAFSKCWGMAKKGGPLCAA